MPATQISFADFAAQALALQAVTPCPPSIVAVHAAASVVAHGGDDAGECITPCADYAEFSRLTALADATTQVPYRSWSRGGYVLAALANCLAPVSVGESPTRLFSNLRFHAAECIGAGC